MQHHTLKLMTRLKNICHSENALQAEFLRHLGHFLESRGYAELGFSSLFDLCTKGLGLSCPSAATRLTVARLALRVPEILEWLERGDTNLTSIRLLAKVLTEENAAEILGKAKGRPTREVERLAASLLPERQKKKDSFRAVLEEREPSLEPPEDSRPSTVPLDGSGSPSPSASISGAGGESSPIEKKEEIVSEPQSARAVQTRLSATLEESTMRDLERMRQLSSLEHADFDKVLSLLLREYLDRHDPLRKPRPAPRALAVPSQETKPSSRYIPREVRRAVWHRDGGRCCFVSPLTGERCQARQGLEVDHVTPFARGGSSTDPGNLRLLCRTHNQWEARRSFGAAHVDEKIRRASRSRRVCRFGAAAVSPASVRARHPPPPPDPR